MNDDQQEQEQEQEHIVQSVSVDFYTDFNTFTERWQQVEWYFKPWRHGECLAVNESRLVLNETANQRRFDGRPTDASYNHVTLTHWTCRESWNDGIRSCEHLEDCTKCKVKVETIFVRLKLAISSVLNIQYCILQVVSLCFARPHKIIIDRPLWFCLATETVHDKTRMTLEIRESLSTLRSVHIQYDKVTSATSPSGVCNSMFQTGLH